MKNDVISPEFDENGRPLRRIRSFVRRQGRLTKGQEHALDNYWPVMGVEFSEAACSTSPPCLAAKRQSRWRLVLAWAPRWWRWRKRARSRTSSVSKCTRRASARAWQPPHEEGVENLRVMCHDAVEVLHKMIPDNSLNMVQLFFPDPWHKARHNKRRIVQAPFAELVKSKLKLGGVFHMATDWEALCGTYAGSDVLPGRV